MKQESFGEIISTLPNEIQNEIAAIAGNDYSIINEIRIRAEKPCRYRISGASSETVEGRHIISNFTLNSCINRFINNSIYAYEEEIRNGFITLPGGHRAGICGHTVLNEGKVTIINNYSSLNIRHAREYKGIADNFIQSIDTKEVFPSILVVSPPGCGKTTFIRDIIRILSNNGLNIGVCDERSEIAGMYQGAPSFDLGTNTDVIDACPKSYGMNILLRSMSPDVIVTDEIGKTEDVEAMEAALSCGIGIITTIHGGSLDDLKYGVLSEMISNKRFKKIVFLSKYPRPCTIKDVYSPRV